MAVGPTRNRRTGTEPGEPWKPNPKKVPSSTCASQPPVFRFCASPPLRRHLCLPTSCAYTDTSASIHLHLQPCVPPPPASLTHPSFHQKVAGSWVQILPHSQTCRICGFATPHIRSEKGRLGVSGPVRPPNAEVLHPNPHSPLEPPLFAPLAGSFRSRFRVSELVHTHPSVNAS